MKAEIIAIGTEVLMGQVVNTNAAYISEELLKIGVDVYHHTVVGDNPSRMQESIALAGRRSDLVIISGGLGPTKDDITKKIVANTLNLELVENKESLDQIKEFYRKSNRRMPQSNVNQALMIEGAEVMPNDNGMAPGAFLHHEGTIYSMVPGVPIEMKQMVSKYLVQLLQNELTEEGIVESKIIRFYNITESQLAESLDEWIENQTNPTIAIYVNNYEPTIRISAKAKTLDEANQMISSVEEEIREKMSENIYGTGDLSIRDKVVSLIHDKGIQLKIVESQARNILSNAFVNSDYSVVPEVVSVNDHERLKQKYNMKKLDDESIKTLLLSEINKQNISGAIIVLGDEDHGNETNSGLKSVYLYFMYEDRLIKEHVNLSYRKVVGSKVIEVALMSKLYDVIKR